MRLKDWLFRLLVDRYWMRIEVFNQYPPRPVVWDRLPRARVPDARLPRIALVTPSFNQVAFLERTLRSVIDQGYPKLEYAVQDGGSTDGSVQVIERHGRVLSQWVSAPDRGQADAIAKGFAGLYGRVGPDDLMAWLNSDDLLAPDTLAYVGRYFARHPEVDAVYGHRIVIDEADREVGRWVLPRHDPEALTWVDYVPQETLYWRRRAWDRVGGLDPEFQFALDWDLLAKFTRAKLKIVRLPHFLGCFRIHEEQKTSTRLHSSGAEEMARIRTWFHGPEASSDWRRINAQARRVRLLGAITARLMRLGVRI